MPDHHYQNNKTAEPPPAYDLNRTNGPDLTDSLEYSSNVDSESYLGYDSNNTPQTPNAPPQHHMPTHSQEDATATVQEMHLALLYLLSNPEEFQKALQAHPARGATTLAEWNKEYEEDEQSIMTSVVSQSATPLPYVVFCDDAEVVLPQAHTASQLFGIERLEGIELEAAAGVPSLSQLFMRWLALMPGGDHLNIIDPPGLTVMRIAGGRYRVTAAHRVVWTWMNEFANISDFFDVDDDNNNGADGTPKNGNDENGAAPLQVGDLVTMTIVDVFETDSRGKLLSYCPTFDNRAVTKTNPTAETIRKSSNKIMSILSRTKLLQSARGLFNTTAKNVAETVKHKVEQYNSPTKRKMIKSPVVNAQRFERAISEAEEQATKSPQHPAASHPSPTQQPQVAAAFPEKSKLQEQPRAGYVGDDEATSAGSEKPAEGEI